MRDTPGGLRRTLTSLQPSRAFLELAKALFAKAWDAQAARLAASAKASANKARELEAEIGKVVDRMLEVTNVRALKAFEDRIEALEREKLVALEMASRKPAPVRTFAEMFELSMHFLTSPYDCWKIGGSDARNVVMRLAFDGRIAHTRETGCLNTKKSNVFRMLDDLGMSGQAMVLPQRFELWTSPLPRECSTPELRQHLSLGGGPPRGPHTCQTDSPDARRFSRRRRDGSMRSSNARRRR